jgi:hypothetical protein
LDAEQQQLDAKKVEAELVGPESEIQPQEAPPLSTPNYPDASHQLTDISKNPDLIEKSLLEGAKSLFNLLPQAPKVRGRILELHKTKPELLEKDEDFFKVNHRSAITLITQRIRVSLWVEYEHAVNMNRVMKPSNIFGGTCSEKAFYKLVEDDIRFAYVLTPPADYIVMLKEAHNAGLEKMREMFSANIMDADGNLDTKSAEVVLKAFALIDARLKGAIVQRVDQRSLQLNADLSKSQQAALGLPTDMAELDKQLEKARAELARLTMTPKHPTTAELDAAHKSLTINKEDFNSNKELGGPVKILK